VKNCIEQVNINQQCLSGSVIKKINVKNVVELVNLNCINVSKICPPGYEKNGDKCNKCTITRNIKSSVAAPCPPGQRSDGINCVHDVKQCKDISEIKYTPPICPADFEFDDAKKQCWKVYCRI
tara:strand:- start:229 stop:597 length:369 start_codon:yes stop_codon:yes gene_type:complete